MNGPATSSRIRTGLFDIDLAAGELYREGRKIPLQEQPFRVLCLLLERPGAVVTREALQAKLWPSDTYVGFDEGLNTAIRKLRVAFGDSAESPRYIETIPRKGYRFIAPVVSPEPQDIPALEPPTAAAPASARSTSTRWRRWAIPAAVLAMLLVAFAFLLRPHKALPAPRGRVMLVVLPFQNLSGDPAQDYFSDGLTEETITDLGQLNPESLGVVARTSAMAYKHTDKTIAQIGRELGVDYVLEGSVRREGNEIRISAQLIQVKDQTHLWAQNYQRELHDVLQIEDELGAAIARQVQGNLRPQQPAEFSRIRALNPEAYDLYLKGRFFWNQRSPAAIQESIGYFRKALEKDPNFALAYLGLADAYNIGNIVGAFSPNESLPQAKIAATKALRLDPSLAEAHAALGMAIAHYDFDFPGAEKEFVRAIELNPNSAYAHLFYSNCYLAPMGRMPEAIAENKKALELDPLSLPINNFMGMTYMFAGDYEKSYQQYQHTIVMDPTFPLAHSYVAFLLKITGRYEQGIEEDEKAEILNGVSPEKAAAEAASLRKALHQGGEKKAWEETLKRFVAQHGLPNGQSREPGNTASLYAMVGDKDKSFQWLEKAYADHDGKEISLLKVDPGFNNLHGDPRFADLLRRMGVQR